MSPPGHDFSGGDPDGLDEGRSDGEPTDPAVPGPASAPGVPPPAERVWRHPSELQPSRSGSAPAPLSSVAPPWHLDAHRRRLRLMGAVGTAALAATIAAVTLLWESASSTPVVSASRSLAHAVTTDELTARRQSVPPMAAPAVRSLVVLLVGTSSHPVVVCGMAVGGAGLVAAPASSIEQAGGRIRLATAQGGLPATEVAVDPASDVALVRVPSSVTPPPIADNDAMMPGRAAIVLSMTNGGGQTSLDWARATIASVWSAVPTGSARDMDGIVADVPVAPRSCGALLLDTHGAVVGLLSRVADNGQGATEVFLPVALVEGVSDQLALGGTVRHGWLDMSGDDAPVGGVVVGTVDPAGAAAGVLQSGDVIEALSGEPVRSMAELRTRLYVLPPGASVALEVVRHGRRTQVDVELGGSP